MLASYHFEVIAGAAELGEMFVAQMQTKCFGVVSNWQSP